MITEIKEYNNNQLELIKERTKSLSGIDKDEIIFNALSSVLKKDKAKYLNGEKKLSLSKINQIEKKSKQLVENKVNRVFNRQMLKSVVQHTKKWGGVNVDEIVANAAVLTLKNYQAYLAGTKKLTPADLRHIHKKATTLVDNARKLLVREANTIPVALATKKAVDQLRTRTRAPGETRDQFKKYLLQNYYHVMGLQVAYGKWSEGAIIKGPQEGMADYKVQRVITHPHGLQIVVLFPTNILDPFEKPAPIFCCRGSCTIHNLFDDLGRTVGSYSFSPAKELIKESLVEAGNMFGPVVLTGHSLGGAIGQLIAANFCDIPVEEGHSIIKEVHMYNAPGVGVKVAHEYANKRNAMAPENWPEVYHVRHVHDVVSVGGGCHIEVDFHQDTGEWDLPIHPLRMIKEVLAAHSRVNFIKDYILLKNIAQTVTAGKKLVKSVINFSRKTAGLLLRVLVADMMYAHNMYNHHSDQIRRFIHSDDGPRVRNYLRSEL
ncbi:MAG: lipase family protein [Parachlamydia sp.]|nr:lipase family protein [Parachlamydia sp.]